MVKGTHSYHLDRYSIYWWISWGATNIPKHLANFIGDRIADWLFRSKSGDIVSEQVRNLDHILGDSVSAPEKTKIIKTLWRRHGRFLLDLFRFERMSDKQIKKIVTEFQGVEHIHSAVEKGKGAIILTAHLGHWELGGILLKYLGFKVNVVQYLYDSERQNSLLDKNKQIRGIKIIDSDDPTGFAISVHNALRRNELVAIQGDRDLARNGVRVNFFGHPAWFPKGPVLLAMKTGAPLIPAFTIMGRNGRYQPVAEPEISLQITGDMASDLETNVSKVAAVFEKYVRLYPEQWFNFYYFWE
ncbi:MAG: lysophospholipid acyltransferase family protein [Nitrospirota bacterium]